MDDRSILERIHALVDEERTLREQHVGEGLGPDDRARLRSIEADLDQAWDLLRQRRAKAEFGENPDSAEVRSPDEVESYLQ
jgi:Protein of unknown function (DUF2630)